MMPRPGTDRALLGSAALAAAIAVLGSVSCAQLSGPQPGEIGTGGTGSGSGGVGGPSGSGGATSLGGTATGGRVASASGGSPSAAASGGASGGVPVGSSGGSAPIPVASSGGSAGTTKVDLTGKKVLLVVDDPASLDDGDQMLSDLMAARGMVVKVGAATPADASAATQNLIVASSGASGADFATSYKDLAVPILTFGNPTYQPLDFIAGSSGKGNAPSTSLLTVIDATSHLAASFAAGANLNVISPTRNTQISWAVPGGAAIQVASVMGSPTELCVFAYEKGGMMSKTVAPARRASLCWKTDALKDLAIDSYRLMVAAIEWTAGAP
jgi:hypothetical protein